MEVREVQIGRQIINASEIIAEKLEDEMAGILCAWSLLGYKTWSVIEQKYSGYDLYMYLMDEDGEEKIRIEFVLDEDRNLTNTRVSSYDKMFKNGSFRSTSDVCNDLVEPITSLKEIM